MTQPPVPSSRREAREAGRSRPARSSKANPEAAVPAARTGVAALVARHPRAWLAGAIGAAFLLVATGVLYAGAAVGGARAGGETAAGPAGAQARPLPSAVPDPSRLRTCSVAGQAADGSLGDLVGAISNASTGELLFDRSASSAVAQGAVSRVVTAAAAVSVLGPDTRLQTRVFEGSQPNTLVLVGGGDPTLSALHGGGESVYEGAPRLDDLAEQVESAYSGDIDDVTAIVLDATLWNTADKWDATWPRSAQTRGTLSEVTALQVDGDRADPHSLVSPRSTDPVMAAGRAFARALDLDPDEVTFSLGSAVTTRPQLGVVESQPVSVLVDQMLQLGDATLAEHLARVVSRTAGSGGTAASLNQVLTSALTGYGLTTSGVTIVDGSGTSTSTVMPPAFVAAFMAKVYAGGDDLNYVYNSLSVAGSSGQLAARFAGTNAAARGQVTGQIGTAGGVHGIAGIVAAVDGTPLAFALYSSGGAGESAARVALETLVTAAMACGDNLSNN